MGQNVTSQQGDDGESVDQSSQEEEEIRNSIMAEIRGLESDGLIVPIPEEISNSGIVENLELEPPGLTIPDEICNSADSASAIAENLEVEPPGHTIPNEICNSTSAIAENLELEPSGLTIPVTEEIDNSTIDESLELEQPQFPIPIPEETGNSAIAFTEKELEPNEFPISGPEETDNSTIDESLELEQPGFPIPGPEEIENSTIDENMELEPSASGFTVPALQEICDSTITDNSELEQPEPGIPVPEQPTYMFVRRQYYVKEGSDEHKFKFFDHNKGLLEMHQSYIFCKHEETAKSLAAHLQTFDINCGSTCDSSMVHNFFNSGIVRVLTLTDETSRPPGGLKPVPVMFNYDLPDTPELYIERMRLLGHNDPPDCNLVICSFVSDSDEPTLSELLKHNDMVHLPF